MDCPRCAVEMAEVSGGDGTTKYCAECGGLWVEAADLNRILLHGNLPALSAIGGFMNAEELTGPCPTCHVDLVAVEGGERRSLHYDTCESCGGIWIEGPDEDDVPATIALADAEADIVGFFRDFRRR